MSKSFYAILGVPESESIEGIRAAFRALAKRLHPDRAGPQSAERFAEVRRAYEVLVDPIQRRRYDEQLVGGHEVPIRRSARPPSVSPEPLIPEPLDGGAEPEDLIPAQPLVRGRRLYVVFWSRST
jgi:curved DNA-binding protein CbpA